MSDDDRYLRRIWRVHAHGQTMIFAKSPRETSHHVYMKLLLWALYVPFYPTLHIEMRIGDRYKPDLVQMGADGVPQFWGEAGLVGQAKIQKLSKRYPHTHLAMGKWDTNLTPHTQLVRQAIERAKRTVPFDLIRFPADSIERFVDDEGHVQIGFDDVEWVRLA